MTQPKTFWQSLTSALGVTFGAFTLFAFVIGYFKCVEFILAEIVWLIDCHQGSARQRRIVRMNRDYYRVRLAPYGCFLALSILFTLFAAAWIMTIQVKL